MQPAELTTILRDLHAAGILARADAAVSPLSGGVSSEILRIDDSQGQFVLKRALSKLRVADDWFADVSRNRSEQQFLRYAARLLPDAVPAVLYADARLGYFVMPYLGGEFSTWKSHLLAGQTDIEVAERAGEVLGTIHRHSWGDAVARREFDTLENFRQLRIDPYLVTLGQRQPHLRTWCEDEAQRLAATACCLVHGDYSPKNLLVAQRRLVVIDCEVAWYGDPAFDIAFLLNHLLLKGLVQPQVSKLASPAWKSYLATLLPEQAEHVATHTGRLLLLLMAARIDGKSPVEYLTTASDQQAVREFVCNLLPAGPYALEHVLGAWEQLIEARIAGS